MANESVDKRAGKNQSDKRTCQGRLPLPCGVADTLGELHLTTGGSEHTPQLRNRRRVLHFALAHDAAQPPLAHGALPLGVLGVKPYGPAYTLVNIS